MDRVTVEDHRVVRHHLTMDIGDGRTMEVAETETQDHRTGIARRISSWMETKMGIWNRNRVHIVPEVAQLGDAGSRDIEDDLGIGVVRGQFLEKRTGFDLRTTTVRHVWRPSCPGSSVQLSTMAGTLVIAWCDLDV